MTLDRVGENEFVGRTPEYPWGRVFGGQVVGQALMAAGATVEPDQFVHSLHAYFVLGGTPRQSIRFDVDRLRDGRSFSTRRVVARQASGAILNLDASFHRVEQDAEVQDVALPTDVPKPEELTAQDWGAFGSNREMPHPPGSARSSVWLKIDDDLGENPLMHAAAIAYLSDHNPMDAIVSSHPQRLSWEQMMTASLDHNVWFHRPAKATDWLLFDMRGHGLSNARGMATGLVHHIDGTHIATIAQEGLVRSPRTTGKLTG